MDTFNHSLETPSGKDTEYENFPVGSWLLPGHLRRHIIIFYRFARVIDDIADNPDLSSDEKIRRLDGFEKAIIGVDKTNSLYETAHKMRHSLKISNIGAQHCIDLIAAFKLDAVKLRYDNWDDLMSYCSLSAVPVGRYLLDLHGGSKDGYGPSDALCKALQVINHIQDCKEDFQLLNRVYLPMDWMDKEGVSIEELSLQRSTPGLKHVISKMLHATEHLMIDAKVLPYGLKNKRLTMESAAIIRIADMLIRKLKYGDPLSNRITLRKYEYFLCFGVGAISGLFS